jgi:hypothetical protein
MPNDKKSQWNSITDTSKASVHSGAAAPHPPPKTTAQDQSRRQHRENGPDGGPFFQEWLEPHQKWLAHRHALPQEWLEEKPAQEWLAPAAQESKAAVRVSAAPPPPYQAAYGRPST